MEVMAGPEIPGSKCETCGSVLLGLSFGAWCDFCCEKQGDGMTSEEVLDNLLEILALSDLDENKRANMMNVLDDFSSEAYTDGSDNGYDSGYDNGRDDCDCD